MLNPITRFRLKHGLNKRQAAMLLGLTPGRVSQLENGYSTTLGEKTRSRLAALGYDVQKIEQEYKEWRRWYIAKACEELQTKLAK